MAHSRNFRPTCSVPASELSIFSIWNDNIQSFRPETSEVVVFHTAHVHRSNSVSRMQTDTRSARQFQWTEVSVD